MRRVAAILLVFIASGASGQQEDLKKYLDALTTIEFEESQLMAKEYAFDGAEIYSLADYANPKGVLFETDIPGVKGYKALTFCKVKRDKGIYEEKKMLAVMYYDKQKNHWSVYSFKEPADLAGEYKAIASGIDKGSFTTKKPYAYKTLSYWCVMTGKLEEAQKAIQTAEQEAQKIKLQEDIISNQKKALQHIL